MSRKGHRGVMMEGLIVPTKIRKRGCSSSSSSSSRIYDYRLNKRAILVGKNRAGLGVGPRRSRSSTPVPTWKTTPSRGPIESPKCPQGGKSARPISARRLAATLWEMNGMPSPKMSESNLEVIKRQQKKMVFKGEKMRAGLGLHLGSGSGYLPPHLSDPPHSPTVSEKMDRSGTGSHRRRTPSISQRPVSVDQNVGVVDSISNASFMEIETRSRPQTSSGSAAGSRSRLKDISSALTTSKELLKIINRMWARADQPSSSLSLISALHTELERARLHVNHLIQEQRSEKNEINYLIKHFAEEKASWQSKQQEAIEAAVGPIAGELEVERKLRRRLEGLNGKLGKELEREKRARERTEQEREMLELADKLREERVQMKLSEAKHQFEEKNSAIGKLRKHLEAFLGTKRDKNDTILGHENEGEDGIDSKEDSGESDLHSIELDLNGDNNADKGYKWDFTSNGIKARNSVSRLGLVRENHSPSLEKERSWALRDTLLERSSLSKSRIGDVRGAGQSNRRSKR